MTDIHQHLIWGIDDGAKTSDIMQTMLRESHNQGIHIVMATPHAQPGFLPFDMGLYQERLSEAQQYCCRANLNVQVCSGAEIAWTYQSSLALRQGRVPTLGETDYVLLELWRDVSWQTARDAVNQLKKAGYFPILAHAERYLAFLLSPKSTIRFCEQTGALLQVNADTLLNPRNLLERRFTGILLQEEAIDAIASDAHDCENRPIRMREAYDWLVVNTDETYARSVTTLGGVFI